jgi:hypothetical protein
MLCELLNFKIQRTLTEKIFPAKTKKGKQFGKCDNVRNSI